MYMPAPHILHPGGALKLLCLILTLNTVGQVLTASLAFPRMWLKMKFAVSFWLTDLDLWSLAVCRCSLLPLRVHTGSWPQWERCVWVSVWHAGVACGLVRGIHWQGIPRHSWADFQMESTTHLVESMSHNAPLECPVCYCLSFFSFPSPEAQYSILCMGWERNGLLWQQFT